MGENMRRLLVTSFCFTAEDYSVVYLPHSPYPCISRKALWLFSCSTFVNRAAMDMVERGSTCGLWELVLTAHAGEWYSLVRADVFWVWLNLSTLVSIFPVQLCSTSSSELASRLTTPHQDVLLVLLLIFATLTREKRKSESFWFGCP